MCDISTYKRVFVIGIDNISLFMPGFAQLYGLALFSSSRVSMNCLI